MSENNQNPTYQTSDHSDQNDHQKSRSSTRSSISDQIDQLRSSQNSEFSATQPESSRPDSGWVNLPTPDVLYAKGFLSIPHNLLEQALVRIKHYSAFKIYVYLYKQAFRWIQNEKVVNAKCDIEIATIAKHCSVAKSVVSEALKVLSMDRWISIETQPGKNNCYVIHRALNLTNGGSPKNHDHDLKNHDLKRSSQGSDDSFNIIKLVYQELTNNTWKARDYQSYQTLSKQLQAEDIIRYMRAIYG
jgi:hypothetical protein